MMGNKMSGICLKEDCTACKLCQNICPKGCIDFKEDELGCIYPKINYDLCIKCGLCEQVCPSLNPIKLNKKSNSVYAAYAVDKSIRETSASGGIATTLYHLANKKNWMVSGCYLNDDFEAVQIVTSNSDMYDRFKNSKYVYSDISLCFDAIKLNLDNGVTTLFIGVPCQVAAIKRKIEKHRQYNLLYTVDIICHGFAPTSYFKSHIKSIREKSHKTINSIFFRDPNYKTNNFVFSLYDKNECIYHKKVKDNDVYQIGYHKALIYRENCYNCKYAQDRRIGDLTISDFSGFGQKAPIENFLSENISCIIVNNDKGHYLLNSLLNENLIKAVKRPPSEAYDYEKQLKHPSIAHELRNEFKEKYKQMKDFEFACKSTLRKKMIANSLINFFCLVEIKSFVSGILPTKLKNIIKNRL